MGAAFYLQARADIAGDLRFAVAWLASQIQERRKSGTLLLPNRAFLRADLEDALGSEFAECLEERGRVDIAPDAALFWNCYSLHFIIGPAVALYPNEGRLAWLHEAFDPLLVLSESHDQLSRWIEKTGARPIAVSGDCPPTATAGLWRRPRDGPVRW